jgi:hypothetical protein
MRTSDIVPDQVRDQVGSRSRQTNGRPANQYRTMLFETSARSSRLITETCGLAHSITSRARPSKEGDVILPLQS